MRACRSGLLFALLIGACLAPSAEAKKFRYASGGGYELLAVMQMSSHEGNDVHLGSPDGPRVEFRPLPYAVN